MYMTRPLSQFQKYPETLSTPPDGPNSGYLVIQDEESVRYSFFGMVKNRSLKQPPFPQDKELIVRYSTGSAEHRHTSHDPIFLIPVLNQPLSSNRYYAIVPHGKRIGEAITCSREEDRTTCCFCLSINDEKPRPLDPRNAYQQIAIVPYQSFFSSKGDFTAESITNGFPPHFLRREGWTISTKTSEVCKLDTADGINSKIRARLPEFDSESFIVGKWYCPFVFVKETNLSLRDQVKNSMYYQMTLERRWEKIFSCQNNNNNKSVFIDALIEKEEAFVGGSKAVWDKKKAINGIIWFTSYGAEGEQGSIGLGVEIVERMKWEAERGGFVGGEERAVQINRVEELQGEGWNEFGWYAMVERFNLRRMDGSLVMYYDFKHLDKTNSKSH